MIYLHLYPVNWITSLSTDIIALQLTVCMDIDLLKFIFVNDLLYPDL